MNLSAFIAYNIFILTHLGSKKIYYTQGLMVHLGLRILCPNLEEDLASLYNAAHCIPAITCFQDLVAAHAYDHMNFNPSQADNMSLLIHDYYQYVHWVVFLKYKKELKKTGKLAKESENKRISKDQERFPKQYQGILAPIGPHRNNEYNPKKKIYKIKNLPCYPLTGGKHQINRLLKAPALSNFKVATRAFTFISTILNAMAFLPDAKEFLYWEILVKPYGILDGSPKASSDADDEDDHDKAKNHDSKGKGHDLDSESLPDCSEDKNIEEGLAARILGCCQPIK
ncbi:hypothetical protein VP01_1694g3 [Puccinia sorghi]|uniref:Uncharacterized protein n=1 Tax=Puccinia sorghi TaxID=27349 RepID=A0A0L6VFS8_9BASI|nr:hypothetical protein VP01_1694g3 [Puccinia sorghi]